MENKEKVFVCKKCGSSNCEEREVYWSTGKQLLRKMYCEDCQSYLDK